MRHAVGGLLQLVGVVTAARALELCPYVQWQSGAVGATHCTQRSMSLAGSRQGRHDNRAVAGARAQP